MVYIFRNHDAPLTGRSRSQCVQPALEICEIRDIDARPGVGARPTPIGYVGNAVVTGKEFVVGQSRIEHRQESFRFVLVTIYDRLNFGFRISKEDVRLSHHGTDTGHLEHEPLCNERCASGIGRHETTGLLREVQQNSTGLKDGEVARIAIYNRRNSPVGIDRDEIRLVLLAFQYFDMLDLIRQLEFFENDRRFPSIGCRCCIKIDLAICPAYLEFQGDSIRI